MWSMRSTVRPSPLPRVPNLPLLRSSPRSPPRTRPMTCSARRANRSPLTPKPRSQRRSQRVKLPLHASAPPKTSHKQRPSGPLRGAFSFAWPRQSSIVRAIACETSRFTALELEEMFAVITQLLDGLVDIGQRFVLALLHQTRHKRRLPTARKLLQRAHIEIAIVKVAFQARHIAREKTPVLAHGVAAHR